MGWKIQNTWNDQLLHSSFMLENRFCQGWPSIESSGVPCPPATWIQYVMPKSINISEILRWIGGNPCFLVYTPLLDTRNRPKDKTSWWFPPIPNPIICFVCQLSWPSPHCFEHEHRGNRMKSLTRYVGYVFLAQSTGLNKRCQTLNVTNFVVPLVPLVWPIPSSQSLIYFRGWFLLHSPPQIIAMFEIDER
jgi:hypothetical protein